MKKWIRWLVGAVLANGMLLSSAAFAGDGKAAGIAAEPESVYRTIGLGAAAAFAVAISIAGASYAVGRIGSAAMGALTEKPGLLPRAILFVALAEGLAVLGFAIGMMLLQRI